MKLLTKAIRAKLPQLHAQDNDPDPVVWVKFFCPWSNWTWLATEGSGVAYVQRGHVSPVAPNPEKLELICQLWQDTLTQPLPFLIEAGVLGHPWEHNVLEDFHFFGYVHGLEDELGNFSLREMKSVHGPGMWSALGIERDIHFTPKPLSEVLASHAKTHGWTPTWTPREEIQE